MKRTHLTRCLFLILIFLSQMVYAADTPIDNSSYICSSGSEGNSLVKQFGDGSTRSISFAAGLRQVKKQRNRVLNKIKALRAKIADSKGRKRKRLRKKLRAQKSKSRDLRQVQTDIKQCRSGGSPETGDCSSAISSISIAGSGKAFTGVTHYLNAYPLPVGVTKPVTLTWSPEPASGQGSASVSYNWSSVGNQNVSVTASNCGGSVNAGKAVTISDGSSSNLILPNDLVYQGAFRLPGGDTPPLTFAYGGNAMTHNPDGDSGDTDSHSGSLFITGHDRQAWDTLPNGDQVAELTIPDPVNSDNLEDLPYASFIQNFQDVTAGYFKDLEEIPRVGLHYLNHAKTGAKIHLTWGQHLQEAAPSLGWFNSDLSSPQLKGVWYLGEQDPYRVTGYLFGIPSSWADTNVGGYPLAVGRYRDGGQGGMGPALFAYQPWQSDGSAPASGTRLTEKVLLLYDNAYNTAKIEKCISGYQHTDEWEGGAWLTAASSKAAVVFTGNKAIGKSTWYGFQNAAGPDTPCVHQASIGEFRACIMSDGTNCSAADQAPCTSVGERGWWADNWQGQIIFYDPADLAKVAAGQTEAWIPQPYAVLSIEDRLYLNPSGIDTNSIGQGVQRRVKIGAAAFDRSGGSLYVLEFFADEAKPVVHVWKVG